MHIMKVFVGESGQLVYLEQQHEQVRGRARLDEVITLLVRESRGL